MNISSFSRMPFSPRAAWPELAKVDSMVAKVFWFLVVPLSLLPPVMLYLAGSHYGDVFFQGFGGKPWARIAIIFFLGEIASVTLMGWVIKEVAQAWNAQITFRNAYLLAAIAPIPLWISSLGLLVESLAFNVALTFVALILSCGLILQGVRSLAHISEVEDIGQAADITRVVFGVGLVVWALFMSLPIVLSV
jgi:hypothetical protein